MKEEIKKNDLKDFEIKPKGLDLIESKDFKVKELQYVEVPEKPVIKYNAKDMFFILKKIIEKTVIKVIENKTTDKSIFILLIVITILTILLIITG